MVYYNEFDPFAAAWLRELIKGGHIAAGDVDERSITDVRADDLRGYTQCHFFAGIGVWSYALRRAGWPDTRPVWTGSCPCQPFSAAGKRGGFSDERHLWPEFYRLISQCRPASVFGEQVASKDGLAWLGTVYADLENADYAVGAADLCAAGVGAPHIRQRLWFTARALVDANGDRRDGRWPSGSAEEGRQPRPKLGGQLHRGLEGSGDSGGSLAHPLDAGLQGHGRLGEIALSEGRADQHGHARRGGAVGGLADAEQTGRPLLDRSCEPRLRDATERCARVVEGQPAARPTNGHWRAADWLYCRDGKWRPVEPGTFPLAHGAAARVGRLRAYGNAIVAQAAQAFIEACLES